MGTEVSRTNTNTTQWLAKKQDTTTKFNEGLQQSHEYAAQKDEATENYNQTSYQIYNAKRNQTYYLEQIKKYTGMDFSEILRTGGSLNGCQDLKNKYLSSIASMESLQDLLTGFKNMQSNFDNQFWMQQFRNGQIVSDMRNIDRIIQINKGFERLG